jgi:hypothetical protein
VSKKKAAGLNGGIFIRKSVGGDKSAECVELANRVVSFRDATEEVRDFLLGHLNLQSGTDR